MRMSAVHPFASNVGYLSTIRSSPEEPFSEGAKRTSVDPLRSFGVEAKLDTTVSDPWERSGSTEVSSFARFAPNGTSLVDASLL